MPPLVPITPLPHLPTQFQSQTLSLFPEVQRFSYSRSLTLSLAVRHAGKLSISPGEFLQLQTPFVSHHQNSYSKGKPSFQVLLKSHLLSETTLFKTLMPPSPSTCHHPSMLYSPHPHGSYHHLIIYMLIYLSLPKCELQKEGDMSALFTAVSPVPGTVPGTQ